MTEDTRRSAETPGGEQPVEPGETGSGEAGGEQVETDEEQKNGFRGRSRALPASLPTEITL